MAGDAAPVHIEAMELGSVPPSRKRRSRRGRRRIWHILLPLSVALAIIAGGLAGRAFSETSTTIDKLHSVSTPPPQVSDSTVRDGVEPPQQASTGSMPTPVPTHVDSDAEMPEGSEVQAPGGPAPGETNVTNGAPVETATSEAGPPETGTQGQSTDLTPIAQSTSEAGDNPPSMSATIAPTPTPDGEALAEQQLAGGMTFDTAPAVAAISQYQQQETADAGSASQSDQPNSSEDGDEAAPAPGEGADDGDDDGGMFGAIGDAGSHLRDTVEGAAIAAGVADPDAEPLTILVMGVDARPGSAIDIGVRPDALMVLRLDPAAGTCKGLAIPRDSYVELPGYGKTKINHALMLGGIPYEQLVVEQYLGIEIDHYALIDFTGFAELVDAVGGITIDVPPELASPAVAAGVQTIDGEQALLHARYRGGPDGDFGRIKRQQQIMRGLIAAAEGRDLLTEANRLLTGLQDHIRTDMEIDQLVSLATTFQDQCDVTGLDMNQIPGEVVYGPLIDPLFNLPLSYVVSDPAEVEQAVEELYRIG